MTNISTYVAAIAFPNTSLLPSSEPRTLIPNIPFSAIPSIKVNNRGSELSERIPWSPVQRFSAPSRPDKPCHWPCMGINPEDRRHDKPVPPEYSSVQMTPPMHGLFENEDYE